MAKIEINKNHIDKLKQQKRTVGLLKFEYREDQNFSKWYSLTENLVIKSFGEKSNHLVQLRSIRNKMKCNTDIDYVYSHKLSSREAQDKLKDLLTVFIEEKELDFGEEATKKRGSNNISIKMENTQTINQTFNVSIAIDKIIENIKQTESDAGKAIEAEKKLRELESEIKSKSPTWAKVKDILIWSLNFGRDTFLQVLPIILEKYK